MAHPDIGAAIYAVLLATPAVTTLLGTWEDRAAIHCDPDVPGDTGVPYLHSPPDFGASHIGTKTDRVTDVLRDVVCVVNRGSDTDVRALAFAVRDALQDAALTLGAGTAFLVFAGWPIGAPTGDALEGLVVPLRIMVAEG